MKARVDFAGTRAFRLGGLLIAAGVAAALLVGLPSAAGAVESGHSHIKGMVTSDGSTPLFNVQVYAYNEYGTPVGGAQSRIDGSYDIPALAAGTYRLRFNPVESTVPDKWHAEKNSFGTADPITIASASTITGVDANMEAGHISGQVTDGSYGVGGITVAAYESDGYGGWAKVSDAVTQADGTYDIGVLRTGTHRVMFETSTDWLGVAYGGGDHVWSAQAVDVPVTAGMTTAGIDGVLDEAGHLSGTVTNDGITGLPNVKVDLYQQVGESLYSGGTVYSDGQGDYDLGGLPTGTYHVYFSRAGYPNYDQSDISVTEGSVRDLDVQLSANRIRGNVTAYGAGGVDGIDVRVYLWHDGGAWATWYGTTDSDGAYDIGGLPTLQAGESYRVAFLDIDGGSRGGLYDHEYYINEEELASADDIVIGPSETASHVDATLEAGAIQGRVTSDGTTGVGGATVYAIDEAGYYSAVTMTLPDGTYSFEGLAVGPYRLHFDDTEGVFRSQYSGGVQDLALATPVTVGYGGVTTHDVQLAELGHITGRVTSDGVTGLEGVDVFAMRPAEGGGWYNFSAVTDADGNYDIHGLATGTYKVGFSPYGASGPYAGEWYDNAVSRDDGADVGVTAGHSTSGIDAVLVEQGHVTGTVTDGATGVYRVMVSAHDLDGTWLGGAYTEVDGSYAFHLPAGTYCFKFEDSSYWNSDTYMTEWNANAKTQAAATHVMVANAATATVNAELAREARITGTVTSPEGAPLSGISVTAWPSTFGSSNHWDTTGSDGSYDLDGLEAETYGVSFFDSSGTYFSEWYDDAEHNGAAQLIALGGGDVASGIDAALSNGGHITGTVTSDGETPMKDVIVYAYRLDQYGKWSQAASGLTGADGTYDVPRLETGTYRLRFYDCSQSRGEEWYDDAIGAGTGADVAVTRGLTTPGIDAVMGPAGSIEGTVSTPGGAGLGGVWVQAYVPDGSSGWDWAGDPEVTAADGSYRITGLQAGDYRLKFYPHDTYLDECFDDAVGLGEAQDVTVSGGVVTTGISVRMDLPSRISGHVTSDGTTGISAVPVYLYVPDGSGGWNYVRYTYTDTEGSYGFAGVDPGFYRVQFNSNDDYVGEWYDDASGSAAADTIVVTRGADTDGIDAVLASRGHIAGRVTSDGTTGIQDVYVAAYTRDQYGVWSNKGYDYTDGEGAYEIAGLLPGTYRVEFQDWSASYMGEWFDDKATRDAAADITVTAGATTGEINAALDMPARITGVVMAGDSALDDGIVRAYLPDGAGGWTLAREALTEADGEYALEWLTPGSYRVEFVGRNGYLTEWYDDAPDADSADAVAVAGGTTAGGVSATLTRGGSIVGSVTTSSSAGIEGVFVEAYLQNTGGTWDRVASGSTDSNGSYTITDLMPGDYRVAFSSTADYLGEYWNDRREFELADTVEVLGGTSTGPINAVLDAAGSISGTVTSDGISGIGSVYVAAFRPDGEGGWSGAGGAFTDATGAYTLSGLPAGVYRLRFWPGDGYLGECWDDAVSLDTAQDVIVTSGGDTGNIDATLQEGGHLTGTVTSDGSAGIEGIRVIARRVVAQGGWEYVDDAYTLADGSYHIDGLREGTYSLEFAGNADHVGEFYDDTNDLDSAARIDVEVGSTTSGIDAILSAPAHIAGRVTSDGANGLQGVSVFVWLSSGPSGWVPGGMASTAADGTYDVGGLAGGTYRVRFYDSAGDYLSEYYTDQSEFESATPVMVAGGGTAAGVDAILAQAGSISGTVRCDASTPVAGTEVRVWAPAAGGGWSCVDTELTQADGTYEVRGLRAGPYRIDFEHMDYINEFWDDAPDISSADDVAVLDGADIGGIDATLSAGAVVSGRVTSDGSAGIADVLVRAHRSGAYAGYAYTDSHGAYAIRGLKAGSYQVEFSAGGTAFSGEWYDDAPWQSRALTFDMASGETRADIDAVLARSGGITGTVTSDGVHGIADVYVEVYGPDGSGGWIPVSGFYTDEGGAYRADGLAAGAYRLRFADETGVYAAEYYDDSTDLVSAAEVSVDVGETTGGIDVQMVPAGHITGTVTTDGSTGIPDVYVFALVPDGHGGWDWGAPALTGTDGTYDIAGLSTRTYRVFFYDPEGLRGALFYDGIGSLAGAQEVSVTAGLATDGIDAVLQPAGHITGQVVSGTVPLADIYVYAYVSDGSGGWFPVGFAQTGPDGSYDMGGLGQGEYRIQFMDESGTLPDPYYGNTLTPGSALTVSVTAGETTPDIGVDYELVPDNSAPVSADDGATVAEDAQLTVAASDGVLENDSDANGDELTAAVVSTTTHGTLVLSSDGSYTYRPVADYCGADSFTYRASDGAVQSAVATVSITVTPENDAPVSADDEASVAEDTLLVVSASGGVLDNDADIDGDGLAASLVGSTTHGTLALAADGSYTYQPAANWSGTDTFTYRASDGAAQSAVTVVSITVSPVNDAPVSASDAASVSEDMQLTVSADQGVLANDSDVDGDALTAALVSTTAHGTLVLSANGSYTYQPVTDWSGTDTFAYQTFDGAAGSAVAMVTITVTDVAETPTTLSLTSTKAVTLPVGTSYVCAGTLTAGGAPVASRLAVLESSSNGTDFSATGLSVTTDASGGYAWTVAPRVKTWYRVAFAGDSTYAGSASGAVALSVKPYVRNPIAPSSMSKAKYYTIYGYLKPRHSKGSYPVRIYKWRKTSSGSWKSYGYTTAMVSDYSDYSKYSRKIRLAYAGKWRLRAYAPADSLHVASWSSGYDYVTVK